MKSRTQRTTNLVERKQRADPARFEALLSGISALMPEPEPMPPRPEFVRNPEEVAVRKAGLAEAMTELRRGVLTRGQALAALECAAHVILDNWMNYDLDYGAGSALVQKALGKPLDAFTTESIIRIADGEPLHRAFMLRGVSLQLDNGGRLVSVGVEPQRLRERAKLMAFVGKHRDAETDVSAPRDYHWGTQDPHGRD